MIRIAQRDRGGESIEADVCIVGAGPAGLAVASGLIGSGLQVVILEAGPLEPDMENQRLAAGELAGLPYDPLEDVRARAFGGTAHYWNIDLGGGAPGLRLRRLDSLDLLPRDWVPNSGWPFDLDELAPHYERAEALFGIEGQNHSLTKDSEETYALLGANSSLEAAVFRFGRSTHIIGQQVLLSEENSVTVLIGAIAVQIQRDKEGDVSRINAMTLTGNDYSIEARAYVLAAGGIENARLLLLSGSGRDAIGNERGLVGRFFMEHPHSRAGFVVVRDSQANVPAKEIQDIEGAPGELWLRLRDDKVSEHRVGNVVFGLKRVSAPEMRRTLATGTPPPSVRAAQKLLRRLAGKTSKQEDLGHLIRVALRGNRELLQAAAARSRWVFDEKVRRRGLNDNEVVYRIDLMTEQFPTSGSRVSLSTALDPLGQPLPRLEWCLTESDMSSMVRAHDLLSEQLKRTGFGTFISTFVEQKGPINWGYHHMGTTRMHVDERFGVVDQNLRVHETANLYIAGSSVFPTSGVSNPTLTIIAMSFRLAEHLLHQFQV